MTSFGCWYVHFPLPIVVSNLFFFVMARWGAILMPLIWLLWQVEFVIGFVLLGCDWSGSDRTWSLFVVSVM